LLKFFVAWNGEPIVLGDIGRNRSFVVGCVSVEGRCYSCNIPKLFFYVRGPGIPTIFIVLGSDGPAVIFQCRFVLTKLLFSSAAERPLKIELHASKLNSRTKRGAPFMCYGCCPPVSACGSCVRPVLSHLAA